MNQSTPLLIEMTASDGTPVAFQSMAPLSHDELSQLETYEGGYRGGFGETLRQKVDKSFKDSMKSVKAIASDALSTLQTMDVKPDEITLEMGVNVGFEGSIKIVGAETQANIKVTIKWAQKPAETPNPPAKPV
ncbi:CU044_2847 family protein [Pontibacter sp. G13]|uniref:CU044_2847 family protein n=1 Tax=Pontibacter sp. G13 TaxID=3074898 RepID=UPI00288B21DC|nr:CU044_2847 family protein [Pontibacter sp. G13]WNJ18736.1 CU044_2847 family protein [Pontibacter sp. G13]